MNLRLRLDIHCSSVRSSSRPPGELPAQVTRMSILPKRSRVASTQRWTCSVTLMSPASGSTARPVAAAIFSAAASSGPAVLAVMATSQPSRASNSATQRPMPLLAPVTKATLPSSRRSTATPFGLGGWMVYQISGARKISPFRPCGIPVVGDRPGGMSLSWRCVSRKIAGYRLGERLGQGSAGAVYLARDERLHYQVAVKVLGPDPARDIADTLIHEVRTAAALEHPHIIPVFDAGDEDGTAY